MPRFTGQHRFTVQMTFEVPALTTAVRTTHRMPGRLASMNWLGSEGLLCVSASRVPAESASDAAMIVVTAVRAEWGKSAGPLKMRSWTSRRDRVLVGSRRRRGRGRSSPMDAASRVWSWDDGDDDDGGSAGVREPRRPLPGPGSLYAALELPGPQV
jgi:hypothetical protein